MTEPSGRHLGRKLADIMHDARVSAGSRLIQADVDHKAKYHEARMAEFMAYAQPALAEILGPAVEAIGTPDLLHDLAGIGGDIEHAVGSFLLALMAFLGIGIAGPSAAAAGLLQRLRNESLNLEGDLKLSPQEAAEGILKGQLEVGYAQEQARAAGMHHDTLDALVALTGDPPGPAALQEALRRGYIDEGRFAHGIRESRIRNEWLDVMLALRFAPVSAGLVLAGAIQNHLPKDEARAKIAQAGIDPVNFDWLYETHGRPPGIQELIGLWRRGATDQATVTQAIRESDVKDKYIPAILEMKRHVPPPRSIVAMLRHGAIDDGTARTMLAAGGVEGADADAMIRDAHHQQTAGVRNLSAAETVSLYVEGIVDRGKAGAMLVALKFTEEAATDLLQLADVKREHAAIRASVAKIRTAYDGHRIDRATASTRLDALHLDTAARDQAIHLWDEERAANVRPLTEAQVAKAWTLNLIDDGEFVTRHKAMGYTDTDSELLLEIHKAS